MKLSTLDICMLVLLVLVILAAFIPSLMFAPLAGLYHFGVVGAAVVVLLLWFLLKQLL